MNIKDEPTPEEDTSPETPPLLNRPKRTSGRASMRDEFLALFRDTRPARSSGETAGHTRDEAVPGERPLSLSRPEPSRFLRRFLRQAAPAPEPALSGLASLDDRLGGGFGSGLHLLLGQSRSGKSAFLESVAWEAVGSHRPVIFYALKAGSLRVWERLIATLGAILDVPSVSPVHLRARRLVPADIATLTRLDAALQSSVLPYVVLVDPSPTWSGGLTTFTEDVRSRAEEAADQHGRIPLVILDDVERLLALTGARTPLDLLARLDHALFADAVPGLLAGPTAAVPMQEVEELPVRTVMTLKAYPSSPDSLKRVELTIRKNAATEWKGSIPLLLDRRSGLFADPASGG